MQSLKSRLIYFLLRNRHLLQGRLHKEVWDMNTSVQGFRDQCEKTANRIATRPKGVEVKPVEIEGIKAEWLIPEGAPSDKVIMYVHGGGYVSGSCNDHRAIVSKFAKFTGYTCLVYEYRLAPEFKFPAAVDDSVKVYKWLLANYGRENILTAGESAGGGLNLCLLLALKEQNIELPVAAVSLSPWTDLTCSGESYKTKNKYSLAPLNTWYVFGNHYYGDTPPDHPLISPLFGNLSGLPPLFINSGNDDELVDDGRSFSEKSSTAGVDVTFREGEKMVHCYPLFSPAFREAKEAMDEIVGFIHDHLK